RAVCGRTARTVRREGRAKTRPYPYPDPIPIGWQQICNTTVFLLLVTDTITLPAGFAFYEPDPVRTAWVKQNKKLKKQGIPKSERPPEPARRPEYSTKAELGLQLLGRFKQHHRTVTVQCVLADALYGTDAFMETASALFGGVQVISQLRVNNNVRFRNRTVSVAEKLSLMQKSNCAS
ncbi:MAG: DDE superfamily endonuclease, partial [Candidatus Kentron sp. G]